MKSFLLIATIVVLAACGSSDEKAKEPEQPQAPLAQGANTDAFNMAFEKLMNSYYDLTGHFIAEHKTGIMSSAQQLLQATDSLDMASLKGDTTVIATARTYKEGISAEIKGLIGEAELEGQRKSLQMISDQLYDLIRIVRYNRAIVYHDFCPMAFNNQGAYWLSNNAQIRNPYLPKTMPGCGEMKDSIDFRAKQ